MTTKSVFFLTAASLCAAGALFLSAAGIRLSRSFSQIWQGYYTILVSDTVPVSSVQKRLTEADISTISSQSMTVEFNDFSRMASVPVNRIDSRLASVDPRLDSYMRGLPGYFHQGRWNIYYLALDVPPPFSYLEVAVVLRGMEWRAADFDWRTAILCVVLLGLTVVSVLRRAHRPRIATAALAAGSAPWLIAAVNGNFVGTIAAALVYLGWAAVVELVFPMLRYYLDYRVVDQGRLRPIAGIGSALVLAAGVLVSMEPGTLGWILYSLGALTCISAAVTLLELWKHIGRQHRLFFPIRIQDGTRRRGQIAKRVVLAAWPMVFVSILAAFALRHWGGDVEIPAPLVYPGVAGNTWTDLHRGWEAKSVLPSLADYIAHRAYQSGLAYGVRYGFPQPGEQVVEASYKREGARIVGGQSVVRTYSDSWFRRALAEGSGVVRLLERQPGLVIPEKQRIHETGYPLTYLPVFWLLTFAVCLPAGLVWRKEGIAAVGELGMSASVFPVESVVRRLPDAPWRGARVTSVAEEQRVLVSHGGSK